LMFRTIQHPILIIKINLSKFKTNWWIMQILRKKLFLKLHLNWNQTILRSKPRKKSPNRIWASMIRLPKEFLPLTIM
jgi:hypothetical protein